jgi:hypothetical protein
MQILCAFFFHLREEMGKVFMAFFTKCTFAVYKITRQKVSAQTFFRHQTKEVKLSCGLKMLIVPDKLPQLTQCNSSQHE